MVSLVQVQQLLVCSSWATRYFWQVVKTLVVCSLRFQLKCDFPKREDWTSPVSVVWLFDGRLTLGGLQPVMVSWCHGGVGECVLSWWCRGMSPVMVVSGNVSCHGGVGECLLSWWCRGLSPVMVVSGNVSCHGGVGECLLSALPWRSRWTHALSYL